jgi:hypothetical protein
MRRVYRFGAFVLLAVLWLYFAGCRSATPSDSQPTDSDIKSILEAEWNNSSAEVLLGNLDVIGGYSLGTTTPASKGTVSTDGYKWLLAWEKVGLITIRRDKEYENFRRGRSFSLDRFAELTQGHVQMKIVVTPTERGRQYLKNDVNRLRVLWGKFRITKIVKNEEHKKGVDVYRLIMVNYDAKWNPDLKAFGQFIEQKYDDKRKAIILMKFDPFESKWSTYKADAATANEEFKSNNVDRALSSLD